MLARTFRGQSAERPQQLGETQAVFAAQSLGVVTAQHRHHRHERVLDELLHGLGTPSHGGTRARTLSSAFNRSKPTASEFKNNSPTDSPSRRPCCILTVSRLLINLTPIGHCGSQATSRGRTAFQIHQRCLHSVPHKVYVGLLRTLCSAYI